MIGCVFGESTLSLKSWFPSFNHGLNLSRLCYLGKTTLPPSLENWNNSCFKEIENIIGHFLKVDATMKNIGHSNYT